MFVDYSINLFSFLNNILHFYNRYERKNFMNFKSTLIRILSIVTVAALLLSASGCGESKSGKKKVIKRVIITEESSEENITDI